MNVALKRGYRFVKNKLFIEGAFSFANYTLINGIFLTGFALALGANSLELGILFAIPLFANLLQLVSAFILESTGTKKKTSIISLCLSRVLWVIVILMAFGILGNGNKILFFIITLLFTSIFLSIGNLALLSWMKDLVPVRKLGRFLGKRNMYASTGGMIVYLAGSYFIDRFDGLQTFGYLFLFATLLGFGGILFLRNIPEKRAKIKALSPKIFFSRLKLPLSDQKFRPFLHFGLSWGFAVNLSAPFFLVFMLDDLKLSFFLVSVFLVADTIFRVYGLNMWRGIADKFGAKPLLTIFATISSFTPLAFVFISDNNYWIILPIFIISAISYAGVDIAMGQALFKAAPRKNDAYYFSTFSSLVGLASALGPIIGGLIALLVKNNPYLIPVKIIFIISFLLRVVTVPLVSRLYEPKAREVRDIIQRIKRLKFASVFVNIYSFADYTSKIVLVPHKQLFILQRKSISRIKKDVGSVLILISQINNSLSNFTKKNMGYYKRKIIKLDNQLQQKVASLEYAQDTKLLQIPEQVMKKMDKLEESFVEKSNAAIEEDVKVVNKAVKDYGEKLEKAFNIEMDEKN